tara:strand:- start:1248 stop:2612 length:1365 start_codon:yes stop_codon:yes gene_type:complete
MLKQDTIVAQATAPGRGGVGIVRLSGPHVKQVMQRVLGQSLKPRQAVYLPFYDAQGQVVDQGIALFFQGPHSFTGEDVLELQGHGGQVVMDLLIRAALSIEDIRVADPGEFSQRAFLNNKIDLAQAEAIADLIEATSEQAASNALQSMQGAFSKEVSQLVEALTHLRMYVEAAIDFPEEEIDFLNDGKITQDLAAIEQHMQQVFAKANQGAIIREGMKVVIAGRPNAGKSSLLNALAGKESAIVTDIAGTTRDILREQIHLEGMPIHVIDTAGLRDTTNAVEQIGIERAWQEIHQADRILFLVDATTTQETDPFVIWPEFMAKLPAHVKVTVIRNKVDLSAETLEHELEQDQPVLRLSITEGIGLEALKSHLKQCMGYQGTTESQFSARRRHLEALEQAQEALARGRVQLEVYQAGELLAEELRLAQEALSQITGRFSSDDLLGKIFGSFCIGK